MIGVLYNEKKLEMLARVTIVDAEFRTLYDKFVKPLGNVTDYRTHVSGIRPEDIEHGESFIVVKEEVAEILAEKIVVGHGVGYDLKALKVDNIPLHLIRDTTKYWKFRNVVNHQTPSLKLLMSHFFGTIIQEGEHSSVTDAKSVLKLYKMVESEWELLIKYRGVLDKNGNRKYLRY